MKTLKSTTCLGNTNVVKRLYESTMEGINTLRVYKITVKSHIQKVIISEA